MIASSLRATVNKVLENRLKQPKQKALVVAAVLKGFSSLRQKPVPDLPKRLELMEQRVHQMTESIQIAFLNGNLVLKAVGPAELLLKELRRGTDWYEPWENIDKIVLAAALAGTGK